MSVRKTPWLVLALLVGVNGAVSAQETPTAGAATVPSATGTAATPAAGLQPTPGTPPSAAAGTAAGAAPMVTGTQGGSGTPAPTAAATPGVPAADVSSTPPDAGTPTTPDPLVGLLVDQGLENVVVHRTGSELRVAYENRRYRWDVTGLGVVLALAAREAPPGAEMVVIPKIWGVPQLEVRVAAADYRQFLDGTLTEKEFARRFWVGYHHGGSPAAGANRSFGRADITAGLGYRASFTTEDPNEGFHPRFVPGQDGALFPGIGFSSLESVSLDGSEPAKLIQARAGGVLHPVGPLFLALSGGRLGEDLDAVQGEAAWTTPSGRTSARLAFATGYNQLFAQNAHSALMTLTQWVGRGDIALSVTGGRFWEGDQGVELFLQSGFRERRFVIGGGRSGGVTRAEVQVILPLGPRVQPEPRPLRFEIRDDFTARYRAPKGLITAASVGGDVPASLLDERTMLFSPPIIRSYLKELRRSADLLQ